MIQPDPKLGELLIAAARIRMDQQVRGIPAPVFKFPAEETADMSTKSEWDRKLEELAKTAALARDQVDECIKRNDALRVTLAS